MESGPSAVGGEVKHVQLGLPGAWAVDKSESSDHYTTKIGGQPDWPPSVLHSFSKSSLLKCALCGKSLGLVAQVHAPIALDHGKQLNERTIFILGCPAPGCEIDPACWRAIRVQREPTSVLKTGQMKTGETGSTSLETSRKTTESRVAEPSADCFDEESSWGVVRLDENDNTTKNADESISMDELAASLLEAGRLAAKAGHGNSHSSRGSGVGNILRGRGSRQKSSGISIDKVAKDSDSAVPILPCFYIYFQDEGIPLGKARVLPSSGLQEALPTTSTTPSERSGAIGSEVWEGEEYEPDRALHVDSTYLKFKKHLDLNPEQCFRYSFDGQVLGAVEGDIATGNCAACGGPRVYEMQLMPPLLYFLQQAINASDTVSYSLDEWDWFTLIICTCAQSCSRKAEDVHLGEGGEDWTIVEEATVLQQEATRICPSDLVSQVSSVTCVNRNNEVST